MVTAGSEFQDRDAGIEETLCQRAGVVGDEIPQDRDAERRARAIEEIEVIAAELAAELGRRDVAVFDRPFVLPPAPGTNRVCWAATAGVNSELFCSPARGSNNIV